LSKAKEVGGFFEMREMKDYIIRALHKHGLIKTIEDKPEGWILKSGDWSPIYINLRQLPSYPTLLYRIASEIGLQIEEADCDAVVGVPMTGIPIATAVGLIINKPVGWMREMNKKYGEHKLVELPEEYKRVVIVDDVITMGASKKEVIDALIEDNRKCIKIIVVVDRRLQKSSDINIPVEALFTLEEIVRVIKISDGTREKLLSYIQT